MITLIVPVYNEEPFLSKCLASIAHQTIPFNEVIIIDDGSTDRSKNIITKYVKKYKWIFIENEKNCGVSVARNKGIQNSSNDYFTFLDSDDELLPRANEVMQKAITKYGFPIIQFNHYRYYGKTGIKKVKYKNEKSYFDMTNLTDCQAWYGVWNKVYKKEYIKNSFYEDMQYGEDAIFNLENLSNGLGILTLPSFTVIHKIVNSSSLTKIVNKSRYKLLYDRYISLLTWAVMSNESWVNIKTLFTIINNYVELNKGKLE